MKCGDGRSITMMVNNYLAAKSEFRVIDGANVMLNEASVMVNHIFSVMENGF